MASTTVGATIATVNPPVPEVQPTSIASVFTTPSLWIASSSKPTTKTSIFDHPTSPTLEPALPDLISQSAPLNSRSLLMLDGIGPVRVGMTLAQAEQAAGVPIPAADTDDNGCGYTRPQGMENLLFMVTNNQISRVDVVRDSPIRTVRGAGIGDTAAEIEALYSGHIQVSPHEYIQGGHYLSYIPTDAGVRNYGIVFETDENDIVIRLRSGKLPEVTWYESCF